MIIDWLTTVDHKKIEIIYGAIALFFLIIGGVEALIIRTQLAIPENQKITEEDDHGHGIHMPSNSWMPLIASIGFVPLGLGVSLMQAGIPFMGYFAIFGLILIALGTALWALEGPGGYHLFPGKNIA